MLGGMRCTDQLLTIAAEYGRATGLEPKTVSWRVFGDTKKLEAVSEGGDLSTRRFENAVAWFSANWPDDGVWPDGISRPDPDEVPIPETMAPAESPVTRNDAEGFRP